MKRVLSVFGTRPEAIKMAPLVKELQRRSEVFESFVCVTGQHRQMLDSVLNVFNITPDYDLNIMRSGQTLFDITTSVLSGMQSILEQVDPEVVLVHGDTTTSFAAGLAAFYKSIPVGHVEAGLRTYRIDSPFPEEFNRQAVDSLCTLFFAPTETARENLLAERKPPEQIYVTGNTGIDALNTTVSGYYTHPELEWVGSNRLILITAHRRENLGSPMKSMFAAIRRIAENYPDVRIIYPVHLNPDVRLVANGILGESDRVHLIEPLDVLDFHNFMSKSYLIMTDSGGIQEEAPSLGKPVLVMRDTTERPEGIRAGTLRLVGTQEDSIYRACTELLTDDASYRRMSEASNPYGDGHASERIADILERF